MSKFCVVGRRGLIGGAIARKLGNVTSFPTKDTRVIFNFGSYSHVRFEENTEWLIEDAVTDAVKYLRLCKERGILYVYPSSALVYEKDIPFSRLQKVLESLAACYGGSSLGCRIFPVYGPGEQRSVISQWCAAMSKGERPTVYGDGNQTRDFIYVDDAADQILSLVGAGTWGSRVADIGAGVPLRFNGIVDTINRELGTALEPRYVGTPHDYSPGIVCSRPGVCKVDIVSGIRRILESLGRSHKSLDFAGIGNGIKNASIPNEHVAV